MLAHLKTFVWQENTCSSLPASLGGNTLARLQNNTLFRFLIFDIILDLIYKFLDSQIFASLDVGNTPPGGWGGMNQWTQVRLKAL